MRKLRPREAKQLAQGLTAWKQNGNRWSTPETAFLPSPSALPTTVATKLVGLFNSKIIKIKYN